VERAAERAQLFLGELWTEVNAVTAGSLRGGVARRRLQDVARTLFAGGRHKRRLPRHVCRRALHVEGLERREMYSVSSLSFSGNTLVVKTNNSATSVAVSKLGSNIRIDEVGTNHSWNYPASKVGSVEFRGGAGNDRFVNDVANVSVIAVGGGGNDYLKGASAIDQLFGGDGDDILFGGGSNDLMWGEKGNDIVWGGIGNDVLLGGDGNDQLMGEAGNDRINGQAGVDKLLGGDGGDVAIGIDAAFSEHIEGGAGADIIWTDRAGSSKDNVVGNSSGDILQEVASFANGADRSLNGDRIADPAAPGKTYKAFTGKPLFATAGPTTSDVDQGRLTDCYFLAGLGAIARDNPNALRQNVVDFGDGTYGVRLGNNFYRVDNDLPVANPASSRPAYAALGAERSMWVAVVEKAFAHYRRGANSYSSLQGGWGVEVNRAFRAKSVGDRSINSYSSAAAMAADLANLAAAGQAVTIGFLGARVGRVPLVMNHMYAVASIARSSSGAVASITLFNPWGTDGGGSRDSNTTDGLVTLSPAQIYAQYGRVNWGRV
jgi:hypothetical protein